MSETTNNRKYLHICCLYGIFVSSSSWEQLRPPGERHRKNDEDIYNLNELMVSSPEVTISIKPEDLAGLIDQAIAKAKAEFAPKKEETYITAARAAEVLEVDRSTLWRWAKSGYLSPVEVGGKRRYRTSEVEKIQRGGRV